MNLHVLGIPHTITNKEYVSCAFTQKVLKFCKMMHNLGYVIYHYGHENSNVDCKEHVTVITQQDLNKAYGDYDWKSEFFKFSTNDHVSKTFTKNAIKEIHDRVVPGDAILAFWGVGHLSVIESFKDSDVFLVEPGIGYPTTCTQLRIFESYAWMHYHYGKENLQCAPWYDAVIPNYFDPDDFKYSSEPDDYALYLGRFIGLKGIDHAIQATAINGIKLLIAGQGDFDKLGFNELPSNVEIVGFADVEKRKQLMSKARVLLAPTYYIEPFGGVTIEAMMSGTPVITTDWGAFPENIQHGVTGYRCRDLSQMAWALENIDNIDRATCRDWALSNFSLDRVSLMYHEYFSRLKSLHMGNGIYSYEKLNNLNHLKKSISSEIIEKDVLACKKNKEFSLFKSKNDIKYKHVIPECRHDHLGGNIVGNYSIDGNNFSGDPATWTPTLWDYLVDKFRVKTVFDVGCGMGYSSDYFVTIGCNVIGLDGLFYNTDKCNQPTVTHDLTKGSFLINDVDLVWCCEVAEHIDELYVDNFIKTISCGNIIALTAAPPGQLGHNHVNCQPQQYWINLLKDHGYIFMKKETEHCRKLATSPDTRYDAHFKSNGMIFKRLDSLREKS